MVAAPSSYSYTTTKISQNKASDKHLINVNFWQHYCMLILLDLKTNLINLVNFTSASRLTVELHAYSVEITFYKLSRICQFLIAHNFNLINTSIEFSINSQLILVELPTALFFSD